MAKQKFEIDDVDYLDIRDIAFSYSMPDEMGIPDKQAISTSYEMEIVKMFSLEQQIIRVNFTIRLHAGRIHAVYTTEHLFHINNLSVWITPAADSFEVNEDLDDVVTGLVYSTARGLLRHKFTGTWFSDFVLPIAKSAIPG